jgi:hypothetical protein
MEEVVVPKLQLQSRGKPTISRLTSVRESIPSENSARENFPSVSDNDDCAFDTERSSRKKKRSRKQSRSNILLGAIKKELKEVEANPAIKKHRKIKSGTPKTVRTNLERFNESTANMSWPRQNYRRRYNSISGITSRSRRRSSVSSAASGEVLLTDLELRKINMLQTLQNMGMKLPKRSRKSESPTMNEIVIMENMQLKRKRSLTTRMLLSIAKAVPAREARCLDRKFDLDIVLETTLSCSELADDCLLASTFLSSDEEATKSLTSVTSLIMFSIDLVAGGGLLVSISFVASNILVVKLRFLFNCIFSIMTISFIVGLSLFLDRFGNFIPIF